MSTEVVTFTERQIREKEFYNQYVSSFDMDREVDLSPVKGNECRQWNSYWMVYHLAQWNFRSGARLLDFGSGPGDNAIRFSEIGYDVEGFDICENNVDVSRKLFQKYGRTHKGNFKVSVAESLPYPDDHFDFVAGIDILHHVDIAQSLKECRRVLKKGGLAVFREPVEAPLLDRIRESQLVQVFFPKTKSLDLHITEDERKLNEVDMNVIRAIFPTVRFYHFILLARFDKFFRKGSDPSPSLLERLDRALMGLFPVLKHLSGARIIVLEKL